MKQFYYSDGEGQFGPLGLEALKSKGINKNTLVWTEGMEDWKKASEVEELKEIFRSVPPPLPGKENAFSNPAGENRYSSRQARKAKAKRNKLAAGIAVLACLLVVAILVAANHNVPAPPPDNDLPEKEELSIQEPPSTSRAGTVLPETKSYVTPQPKPREKTVEELQAELYDKECRTPLKYLSETHDISYRILSGKHQVSGEIFNSATMATFKDVVLTLTYYTQTGTELGSERFAIYKYCYPGQSVSFDIRTYSPKGCKSLSVEVSGAEVG